MTRRERHITVRGIRRKQIDEDKLALAFLLLAKSLHEQGTRDTGNNPADDEPPVRSEGA